MKLLIFSMFFFSCGVPAMLPVAHVKYSGKFLQLDDSTAVSAFKNIYVLRCDTGTKKNCFYHFKNKCK